MCKFRPGSGHFLDLPGKAKERRGKNWKHQEIQGLNFLYNPMNQLKKKQDMRKKLIKKYCLRYFDLNGRV